MVRTFEHLDVEAVCHDAAVDPWGIAGGLESGSPAAIEELADAWARTAQCVAGADDQFGRARSHFTGAYLSGGDAVVGDSPAVRAASTALTAQSRSMIGRARRLREVADALDEAQRTARETLAPLERELAQVDGQLASAGETGVLQARLHARAVAAVEGNGRTITAALARYREALEAAVSADTADTAEQNPTAVSPAARQTAPAGSSSPFPTVPAFAVDAATTHAWWTELPADERTRLLTERPESIGNLVGIPVADRDGANRRVLARDLGRVTGAAGASPGTEPADVVRDPARFGLGAGDITRYLAAQQCEQGLTRAATIGAPALLMAYAPTAFDGRGRVALAYGNPDTAQNTAVLVPGTGSSVRNGYLGRGDAGALYREARNANPTAETAVIAWMGYRTPDSPSDPAMLTPRLARDGARLLAEDINGLKVTHQGSDGAVRVIGHSYGATTVADAAASAGMHARDVVLIGCPGTDIAHRATDFHLDGGHVFVGSASSDPVTHISEGKDLLASAPAAGPIPVPGPLATVGLGPDPAADGYGSVRFRAEVPGGHVLDFDDHSRYFAPGSEALFSMADIAAGNGSRLQAEGMTADHRIGMPSVDVALPLLGRLHVPFTGGPEIDPESLRRSIAADHVHVGDEQRQPDPVLVQ